MTFTFINEQNAGWPACLDSMQDQSGFVESQAGTIID